MLVSQNIFLFFIFCLEPAQLLGPTDQTQPNPLGTNLCWQLQRSAHSPCDGSCWCTPQARGYGSRTTHKTLDRPPPLFDNKVSGFQGKHLSPNNIILNIHSEDWEVESPCRQNPFKKLKYVHIAQSSRCSYLQV